MSNHAIKSKIYYAEKSDYSKFNDLKNSYSEQNYENIEKNYHENYIQKEQIKNGKSNNMSHNFFVDAIINHNFFYECKKCSDHFFLKTFSS